MKTIKDKLIHAQACYKSYGKTGDNDDLNEAHHYIEQAIEMAAAAETLMQKQALFATPETAEELQQRMEDLPAAERRVAVMFSCFTWNLASKLLNDEVMKFAANNSKEEIDNVF